MILQALVRCYDALAADGKLDQLGWLKQRFHGASNWTRTGG